MKVSNIKPVLDACFDADDSVRLIGVHGIGKTDIIKEWCSTRGFHVEFLHLSTNDVGDLIGIPHIVNGVTTWAEPSWLNNLKKAASNGKHPVLALDEFSRAPLDVRQAALQLVLDKKIHQHILPSLNNKKTFIIAADNPDDGNYAVETLDDALLDRFININLEVDVPGWLEWSKENNVNNIVREFIRNNPSKLFFQAEEGSNDTSSATPRSWTKLAKYVDNFSSTPPELHFIIIDGKVGKFVGLQFLNFYKNFKDLISVDDVIELIKNVNGSIEKVGGAVNTLLENSEVSLITELAKSIIQQYSFHDKDSIESRILLGTLYGLNVEVLTAVLLDLKEMNVEIYDNIAELDEYTNNKELFRRITSHIEL